MSDSFPAGLALTGGIPLKGQDLAASIIYLVAYVILFPIASWRLYSKSSRCWSLVRPFVFILARIVTYIFRALQANGNYAEPLFIGEQILLLCGFILLCEPLLTLLGYHMMRNVVPSASKGTILVRIQLLLKVALTVALILGVYAGAEFGSLDQPSTLSTVKTCRNVNAIICTVVTALAVLVAIASQFKESPRLPVRWTVFLVAVSGLLVIPSAYRIVLYTGPVPGEEHVGTKVAFYCLFSLPEFLVATLYVSVNLNDAFEIPAGREKEKVQKQMKNGTFEGVWNAAGSTEAFKYGQQQQQQQGQQQPQIEGVFYPPQQQQQPAWTGNGGPGRN